MTAERPEWIGWLPNDVQEIANAAARAGLIPIVCDDDESFDLWAPGSRYLACVGTIGEDVTLFHGYDEERDTSYEVQGIFAVLAWVAGAVDTAPAKV
jgi:hypothetical protein